MQALEDSIRHWEENVAAVHPFQVNIGMHSCALCTKFWKTIYDRCEGCPVYEVSGQRACANTPYEAAVNAYIEWRYTPTVESHPQFRYAATIELNFLRSLRHRVAP